MNKFLAVLIPVLCCVLFQSVSFAQYSANYVEALNSISEDEIKDNLYFFASDSLKGRPAGSDENLIAALFIANKFKDYGLTGLIKSKYKLPSVDKDDETLREIKIEDAKTYNEYFQSFTIEQAQLSKENSFSVHRLLEQGELTKNYNYDADFLIQYGRPENISVNAPVIFAGYGITKGENGYNDYVDSTGKEIDVDGKIVVIIDGYPQESDASSVFSKSRNALYRNPIRKAEAAADKGALAIIVIQSPYKNEPPLTIKYEALNNSFKKQFYLLPENPRKTIPIIYVNKQITDELINKKNLNIKHLLQKIETGLIPQAFELAKKKISFNINFETKLINTQNVIGFIEGTDPELKNEVVVFGAHYDHVGLGYYGAMDKSNVGLIHNGADDNASGTTGIIELAEAFAKSPPKRSVLIIAFTAEENGLLGSKYYCYFQPIIPLEKTAAMLNLDMIGRNEPELLWIGGGFYGDDMRTIVEEANKSIGFELLYNTGLLSYASDQGPFLNKKIPVAFFFTGLHDDYHTPADDAEKISFEKIEKVTKLAFTAGSIIGNGEVNPVFRELTNDERALLVKESISRLNIYRPKNSTN